MPRKSKLELPYNPKDIGRRVRFARLEFKYGLRELARDSGVEEAKLSRVENGKRSLNLAELIRVCNTLEIREGWVISGEEPKERGSVMPLRGPIKTSDSRAKPSKELGRSPTTSSNS